MAQHGRIVKQSYCETVLVTILFNLKFSTTALEAPFHFGCAFPMCTGVETVTQSLDSIETNQGLFHSLRCTPPQCKKSFGIRNEGEVQGQSSPN